MNPAQLLAHFDRISEAPGAVPRLRRFILDLAVRGKLVEQDSKDEPASILLARLLEGRHVSAKARSQPPSLTAPGAEELPFELPRTWLWVRLRDITSYIQRGKSPHYATSDGLPVVSQRCVQWSGLDLSPARLITFESFGAYEEVRHLRDGDLLWNSTGTGTIGRVVRVTAPPPRLVCDSHVTVVRCLGVDPEFVRCWLRSDHVYGVIEDRAAGSTNQVELTSQMANGQLVPLAPLAEQHRIVAKIGELMALCDRLEAAQSERETRRDRVATASLNRLNEPAAGEAESFRDQARFHLRHLPRLTARLEHIQKTRHTILDLAVRGRLVRQDSEDEPATDLLCRINRSRKHRRNFVDLAEAESPLPLIPGQWTWTVVDRVSADEENAITDGPFGASLKTEHYVASSGFRVVRLQNIGEGVFRDEHRAYIDRSRFEDLSKHRIFAGDLVVAGLVDPRVRCCELPSGVGPAVVKADCYRLAVHPHVSSRFALCYLNSPTAQEFAAVHHHGMTLTRIGLGNLRRIPFPLPPLAEQHRIVAKVDELMAICDQLEAQLTTAQTESRRLLEAILHQALSPVG